MQLAKRSHTEGDRRRFVIDYSEWLDRGNTVESAVVTSDSTTATVDDVTTTADKVIFFVNGGSLNETFTVSVAMTDTRTEIKNDTIDFTVVAP